MTTRSLFILLVSVFSSISAWGGRSIVPPYILRSPEFRLSALFLNHYTELLEATRTNAINDSIQRVKDNGFQYLVGNDKKLLTVSSTDDFSITLDNTYYRVSWKRAGAEYVICTFPANIGLLTFSSKIDLENSFIQKLRNKIEDHDIIDRPCFSLDVLDKITLSDFYIVDKGYYITPRLKHQIVVAEQNGKGVLMYEPNSYSLETLSNIILSGYSPNDIITHTSVSQYGYKSTKYTVSYSSLYRLLSEDGSEPYWGVDKFDGKIVKGICVWVNKPGGYAHVLNISIPINSIFATSEAEVKIHCYVRLDNLRTLFEEYTHP